MKSTGINRRLTGDEKMKLTKEIQLKQRLTSLKIKADNGSLTESEVIQIKNEIIYSGLKLQFKLLPYVEQLASQLKGEV